MRRADAVRWVIEDHVCRHCSGRVLRCVAGGGATGGGNPIFRCADCGTGAAAMGPEGVCWCGFEHRRGNHPATPYACVPLKAAKDDPAMRDALLACGFNPDLPGRAEMGVYMPEYYRERAERRAREGGV